MLRKIFERTKKRLLNETGYDLVGGFEKKKDRDRVDSLNMQIFSITRVSRNVIIKKIRCKGKRLFFFLNYIEKVREKRYKGKIEELVYENK